MTAPGRPATSPDEGSAPGRPVPVPDERSAPEPDVAPPRPVPVPDERMAQEPDVAPPRPAPVPDERSAPYWEAAARHVLTVARCSRCRAWVIPPDVTCPRCLSADPGFVFEPVSGRGTVRSWTVMRQSFLPGFAGEVPFVLVDVELAEQPDLRMIGRLLDGPGAAVHLGDPVTVAFEDVGPDVSIPAFALDRTGRGA